MCVAVWVGGLALACGPDAGGEGVVDDGAGETSVAGSTTRTTDDAPTPDDDDDDDDGSDPVTTTVTTSDDGADDESGQSFIMNPDGGSGDGCEQPVPIEQPASCDNGTREPDEFCYQGIASIYAMAEGTRLVDFGAGPQVVYVDIEDATGVRMHPATAAGLLGTPTVLDLLGAYDFAVEDLDDDGALDLVVSQPYAVGGIVSVMSGLGDGTFAPPGPDSTVGAMFHVQLADLDDDAIRDLVGTTARYYEVGDIRFGRGLGGGTWADDGTLDLADDVWPAIGDLDDDGLDDLVVLAWHHAEDIREILIVPMTPTGPGSPWVLENSGEFGRPVLGRFDDDATLDIAYFRDGDLVMAFGSGDGTMSTPEPIEPAADYPVAAEDLDGDGRSEIVGTTSVRAATTGETWEFDVGCGHYGTKLASTLDIDGDGLRDIVISTGYGQESGAIHLIESNP